MRLFHLVREVDVTGVSGTGVVAEGVQFTDGRVAVRWLGTPSTAIWDSIDDVRTVHGHGGYTTVRWVDVAILPVVSPRARQSGTDRTASLRLPDTSLEFPR